MRKANWTKRMLALAMCVVMAAFSVPAYAKEAETPTDALRGAASADDFVIEDGVLMYYTGEDSEVTIPSSVTSIGEEAFAGCDSLTKVTIPSSVTSIGQGAFYGCSSLTEVTIGSSVTTIGAYAFDSCWSLTEITIPESVTSIGDRAFQYCESLTEITIPESVTDFGDCVFLYTAWLDARMAENPLVVVNGILIDGTTCSGSADIPDDVTAISAWAFSENDSLTSVTIPSSVTMIDGAAFWECNNLTEVTIPSSVSSIGEEAFYGCDKLETVTLREGVTTIGDCAFGFCKNLRTVNVPPSVTSIADDAFDGSSWVAFYGEEGSYAQEYAKAHNIPFNHPVTNIEQTISGTKTYSKAYGDKAFTLNAKSPDGGGKLTYKSSDTKVAAVSSTGKVTIKGTGVATITVKAAATADYKAASVNVTIKVSPAKQTVKSLKTVKGKKLTVSWKKDARATGYQIQYSTDKSFKKGVKTVSIAKNTTTSKTLTKLTAGKKYYVRVRSYKTAKVSGMSTKLCGAWSAAKRSGSIKK